MSVTLTMSTTDAMNGAILFVVGARLIAPVVGAVNFANIVDAHDGRDQSGPYDI